MTKKVGITGRYGPRYGTKTKKEVLDIEIRKRQQKVCPYCERPTLKKLAAGVWYCRKCKAKFAGGAYFPKSG